MRNGRFSSCVMFFSVLLFSCSLFSMNETKIYVDNEDLNDIYLYEEETLPAGAGFSDRGTVKGFEYSILREARILPVLVSGKQVQANDIQIKGNTAYIAYNTAGETFLGAIQILDIANKKKISLEKEITFSHMDINTLFIDGNNLYFGGQADPDYYSGRAFIARVDLNDPGSWASEDDISPQFLRSYSATGIARKGDYLYVSVGAKEGGIEILALSDLSEYRFIDAADAKDVAEYKNGIIFLTGQTDLAPENAVDPAYVCILTSPDGDLQRIGVGNFGSDYHKATIEIFEGIYSLLGLSSRGLGIINLNLPISETDPFTFHIENPEVSDSTLFPYTNSVSSDGSLIFSSNGNYGFRVLKKTGSLISDASIVGYLPFEDLKDDSGEPYSANHIAYSGNLLFVASGVGGVLVYDFIKN